MKSKTRVSPVTVRVGRLPAKAEAFLTCRTLRSWLRVIRQPGWTPACQLLLGDSQAGSVLGLATPPSNREPPPRHATTCHGTSTSCMLLNEQDAFAAVCSTGQPRTQLSCWSHGRQPALQDTSCLGTPSACQADPMHVMTSSRACPRQHAGSSCHQGCWSGQHAASSTRLCLSVDVVTAAGVQIACTRPSPASQLQAS